MKPENFVYWLQGYFELSNSKIGLSKEQCQIIQNHLKMVFHTTKNESNLAWVFCCELKGYFDLNLDDPEDMNAAQVSLLKEKLSKIFIHEIDPSFGDQEVQDHLLDLHEYGRERDYNRTIFKC